MPALSPHPVDDLSALALDGADRIARASRDGRDYWIKRQERLHGLMRLQKGNPARALRHEALALRNLAGRGLPVPELVAEGPGFVVIADCGPSLNLLLRDDAIPREDKLCAMRAAGKALARLHRAGIVHGRPSIRDFCWKDGAITLIDWERYRPHGNSRLRMRIDVIVFVFNLYALLRGDAPELEAAIDAYRADAPAGLWDEAARLSRRLRWIEPMTRPQQRRDAGRGEFRAIPLTLRRFARH